MVISIQTDTLNITDNLWKKLETGLANIQSDFDRLPAWRRVAARILAIGVYVAIAIAAAAGIASIVTFSAMPILVVGVGSIVLGFLAIKTHEIVADDPLFRRRMEHTLERLKINVFVKDQKLPSEIVINENIMEVDTVVAFLKDEKAEENKQYKRLFGDLSISEALQALEAISVVSHLLISIQKWQTQQDQIKKENKVPDEITKHLDHAYSHLENSKLSPESKKQVVTIVNYLKNAASVFKNDNEYKLSDIDTLYSSIDDKS